MTPPRPPGRARDSRRFAGSDAAATGTVPGVTRFRGSLSPARRGRRRERPYSGRVSEFFLGVAVGLGTALVLAFLEPVQRRLARAGRRSSSDRGVQMHVELDPAVIWAGMPDWIGFHYYIPDLDAAYEPPADSREWRRWAYRAGGWDLATSTARVTLVGTAPVTVVLETPHVFSSEEPLPLGTKVIHAVGGASIEPRAFDVDLDAFGSDHPTVTISDDGGEPISGPMAWSLQKGEVEQMLITVKSSRSVLFHWEAQLPILIDGERVFLTINDNHEPITFAGGAIEGCRHWNGTNWGIA